nr:MAG TPA: hypothetical protein [Caudoviricetes sp.]
MEANMPASSDVVAAARSAAGAVALDALSGKVDKIGVGQVTMLNLSNEVKEALTGGSVPVVGDGSVYPGAIQAGAVTDDKIPVGEVTSKRVSAVSGLSFDRLTSWENMLDVRGCEAFRSASIGTTGNELTVVSGDSIRIRSVAGDSAMAFVVPIIDVVGEISVKLRIWPAPENVVLSASQYEPRMSVRIWDARTAPKQDLVLGSVFMRVDDGVTVVYRSDGNPNGNAFLFVQIPVEASDLGKVFSITMLASGGHALCLRPEPIGFERVTPTVFGDFACIRGIVSANGTVDGDAATWTPTASQGGVSSSAALSKLVDASMGMLEVAFHCDREVVVSALTMDDGNVLHQHGDLMQRVGPGDVRVVWDLAEIDAHKGHPVDRVWIMGTEQRVEYHITGVSFRMVDEFDGDGDLRGTLRRIQSAASKPAGQLRLVSPDGTRWRLTVSDDGVLGAVADTRVVTNVAILGNSLTANGIAGWSCGMAASGPETDWVSLIVQCLRDRNPAVVFHCWDDEDRSDDTVSRGSCNPFETDAGQASIATLVGNVPADADLVILQIGDNVNTDERKTKYRSNINGLMTAIRAKAPDCILVYLGSWFAKPDLESEVSEACERSGALRVDIADLHTQANQNTVGASCTWPDRTTHVIDSSGVAMHPGDPGMQAIADRLWQTLDPLVKQA